MVADGHARGFFDVGRFRWVRGPFTVQGDFEGEPRWDRLLASQDGRSLLACARDWPLLPVGVAEEPDWRSNGGLLVSPWEEREVYEAYREIPAATPPVYRSFANLSLGDRASLIGFARRWGPPMVFRDSSTARREVLECPVLVMAYHARLLWLSIRLLTVIRRPHLSDLPDVAEWKRLRRELGALRAPRDEPFGTRFLDEVISSKDPETSPLSAHPGYVHLVDATWLLQMIFLERLSPVPGSVRSGLGTLSFPTERPREPALPSPPVAPDAMEFEYLVTGARMVDPDIYLPYLALEVSELERHAQSLEAYRVGLKAYRAELDRWLNKMRSSVGVRPVLIGDVDAKGRMTLEPGWTAECLLQRLWIQFLQDVKQAVLAPCSCGVCGKMEFLDGARLRAWAEGRRVWLCRRRSSVVGRERRGRRTPEQRAAEAKRVRDYRAAQRNLRG